MAPIACDRDRAFAGRSPFVYSAPMGRPADAPEFFRTPPPPGRSRESTIVLTADGTFRHDGVVVEHPKLADAMHRWITRHPDDGRFILSNGYDWTYFTVEDAPFFVRAIHEESGEAILVLSDGTSEALDASTLRAGPADALYCLVKSGAEGGPYEAKLTRHAQTQLAPFLVDSDGSPALRTGSAVLPLPPPPR